MYATRGTNHQAPETVVGVTRFSFIMALYRNTPAVEKQLETDSTLC